MSSSPYGKKKSEITSIWPHYYPANHWDSKENGELQENAYKLIIQR